MAHDTVAPPADPHKPLRQDVRLLGALLGDTIRAHAGGEVYETVERVRTLAKASHEEEGRFRELAALLGALPVEATIPLARAFAHFLNLANVAEQHHRIRRRRAYLLRPGVPPQSASCAETLGRLIDGGLPPDQLHAAVSALRIELVLTAHPTEVSRRTFIHKYNRIAALLARRDAGGLTLPEQDDALAALAREIASAWETDEVRQARLTPLDEVKSGLIVFEQSLWRALPAYVRGVDRALVDATGQPLPLEAAPVRFGSWIGGDRDGNPFVTPDLTRRAALMSRWLAATLYLAEVEALRDELSMGRATPELVARAGTAHEPYRQIMRDLRTALTATRDWINDSLAAEAVVPPPPGVILEAETLAAPLRLCHASLAATGNATIAAGRLTDLLRRVAAFGVVLAPLDVRQASDRHADALDAITRALGLGSYAAWDEPTRLAFLAAELDNPRPLIPPDLDASDEVRDVLDTFAMLARLPAESLGAYVITMARQASDVLAVRLLQEEARVPRPLRVVPLFETPDDLRRAPEVLDTLLTLEPYRRRVGPRIEVMVGYSDSAKEAGRLTAGWELYKAQEQIVATCRRHGIAVTLFHGRGGSIGRGGGPTYVAIRAQPAGSVDGTLRVTEQGEMIQALFGLPDIAVRTLEIYTSGTLDAWLAPSAAPRPEWRDCMERLSEDAAAAYRRLVREQPAFVDYFRAATPLTELEGLNIGSRPSRRRVGGGIETLRAIPWQFAWTQTRLLLGAWLGLEEAFERAAARGERERLIEMYREWDHFHSVVDLMEMVLAKTDGRIAAEYDRQLVPAELQPIGAELRDRLTRAIAALLAVTGHRELLEGNPVLRRSIDVRNPYVDPLNLVQIELMRRLRGDDPDDRLRHAFMVTVNGVAAGMRNTG